MPENIQRGKTIDVHAHMVALGGPETEEKYKDIMPRLSRDSAGREIIAVSGKPSYLLPEYLYKPELRLQEMDKNRVDMQVLSMMAPQWKRSAAFSPFPCRKKRRYGEKTRPDSSGFLLHKGRLK